MAWQTFPGLKGRIYIPDPSGVNKKHPCPDCSACQQCSQERCRVCRGQVRPAEKELTPSGQTNP